MLCIPNIALWGGLMIGTDKKLPKTPPLDIVKLPPCISSSEIVPSLALVAISNKSFSILAKFFVYKSLNTETNKPFGEETATEIST